MKGENIGIIFNFFNKAYDPLQMPVIKKYFFRLDDGQAFMDDLCKLMKENGVKQPTIEEEK